MKGVAVVAALTVVALLLVLFAVVVIMRMSYGPADARRDDSVPCKAGESFTDAEGRTYVCIPRS